MMLENFIFELIRQLPGILEGLAFIIAAVLFPAAIVKATKAHGAATSATNNTVGKGGSRA